MPLPGSLRTVFTEHLDRYRSMSVATSDRRGHVNCATVYFIHEDGERLYFASNEKTLKARHLLENPHIAITLSDGSDSGLGLQVRGLAEPLAAGPKRERIKAALERRYPEAKAFFDVEGMTFFEVQSSERFIINFGWGVDWRQAVS